MIIEIPDDNSIIKWKKNDKDEWKSAEISDLIKAYEERPKDYDNNGDIIPMSWKEEKEDVFTRKEELSKEESEWLIDFITKKGGAE